MSKARKNKNRVAKRRLRQREKRLKQRGLELESLEQRIVLTSPFVQGVAIDDGSLLADIENVAPREITLRFDEDQVISSSRDSLAGIVLQHGGVDRELGTFDDVVINPGFIGIGDSPNEVVIRFAENLPDNIYSLQIFGSGLSPLTNSAGEAFDADPNSPGIQDFERIFRLDLGAQITAVVPQPIERGPDGTLTQLRNQIVVYFNDDPLSQESAERPDFYQLRFTGHTDEFDSEFDSVNDMDDVIHLPDSVSYDAETNRAVLTFASNLDELDNDMPGIDRADGTGTYRLQVGLNSATPLNNNPDNLDPASDPGDMFSTAFDVGEIFSRGVEISDAIDPRVDPLQYPGGNDEPGHRDVIVENHFINGDFASDSFPGATTILYNFKDNYGTDPAGNPLQNLITENQKELTRQIVEIYSYYSGIQFAETEDLGFTVATGDIRALAPDAPTGPLGVLGIATGGNFIDGLAIMDAAEDWSDEFAVQDSGSQISWFETAMHEVGHILGLGHTYDLPALTVMGSDFTQSVAFPEPTYPGDNDIAHLQHIHRPESNDADLYKFEITDPGVVTFETFAERLENSSLADTHLTVWHEVNGEQTKIASNDDYFSEDSFLELTLEAGTYYVGVSSTGNTEYSPKLANSGAGGTSEGRYELRIHHRAELAASQQIQDRIDALHPDIRYTPETSQPLDGDYDGIAGGAYNFWFRVATPDDTHIVDKAGFGDFTEIDVAMNAAESGDIIRVVGNGGDDGELSTPNDNLPYEIGRSVFGNVLADGNNINVKKGVTLMIDEGAALKFRAASLTTGSAAPGVDRSGGAIQVLGTNDNFVYFSSFQDDSLGGDSDSLPATPREGDWGGILFAGELDQAAGRFNYEDQSIFLNYVNHADIQFAGGSVTIDSISQVSAPIEMRDMRPTATFNRITRSAESAIAASPDSFEETNFHEPEFQQVEFVSDYTRIGPEIYGNQLSDNSFNGLFIRTVTQAGQDLRPMTVSGRWNDTDIPHVIAENLVLQGQAGNALLDPDNILPTPQQGNFIARFDARLRIDPGTIVKLDGAVIEAGIGSQLIAEGVDGKEVVFTSVLDDTFGGSGSFDTSSDGFFASRPAPGDWGGIYLGFVSSGSIDHALISYGGGTAPIEGSFTGYNAIGVHQADLRLTNSTLTNNAGGKGGQAPPTRFGRTPNEEAAIFIRQAQPILVNNIIENTTSLSGGPAAAISINVSALNADRNVDYGRSTGRSASFPNHIDNQGPLIVNNRIGGNDVNGMLIRGGTLTTEGVWDDQDIVHLVFSEIAIPNYHTSGGLRLESNPAQSLVVKLNGANAGFTAAGRTLDIDDRIGGSLQVVGHPNFPVVLTSTGDNTVGAGRTPDGSPNLRVFNTVRTPAAGDWRSIRLSEFSNDRNLDTVIEYEPTDIDFNDNDNPRNNAPIANAQFLGQLARNLKSGDENLRLGYDIHGTIARSNDVDTYSFQAGGGTEVWFDIDHTTDAFDSVIELVTADGFVLASSESSHFDAGPFNHDDASRPFVNARNLSKTGYYTIDHYSINPRDPGFRVQLPAEGTNTYHLRVSSQGDSAGAYELQVRMSEVDEVPGSTIKFADIRYATNGIELQGVPKHSPLLGEVAEINQANNEFAEAQAIGNVLDSDRGAISVAGELINLPDGSNDVDWYQFDVSYEGTQSGGGYASIALDLDYADGVSGADMSFAVYTDEGRLVAFGDDANIADDLNAPAQGADIDDLTRGSAGRGDAFIGPLSVPDGSYFVAVFPDSLIPREMAKFLERGLLEEFPNEAHKYLPNDAVTRVAQDFGDGSGPLLLEPVALTLNETKFFITTQTNLNTANAFNGSAEYVNLPFTNNRTIGDFDVRPNDGFLFTLAAQPQVNDENSGLGVRINESDGTLGAAFGDDIMTNGVMTYHGEADPDSGEITVEQSDVGLTYEAVGFGLNHFWGVGNRNDAGGVAGTETLAYEENILFRHDYFDLTAEPTDPVRSTDSPNGDPAPDIPMDGPWTQIIDRGFIDTVNSTAGDVRLIVQNDATLDGPNFFVDDGDAFSADGVNYEMEAGVQITLTGQEVRDGDILRMNVGAFTHDFQFNTGPVLALAVPSTDDGATFTFGNSTFEYDSDGMVAGTNIPVDINGAGTVATMAQRIVDAAPAAGLTAVAIPDGAGIRVSFAGDTGAPGDSIPVTGNLGGLFEGEYGGVDSDGNSLCDLASNCIVVDVEESDDIAQLMTAITLSYVDANLGNIDRVGSALARMNFLDGDAALFVERNANAPLNFIDVVTANSGVSGGATAIEFLASDSREDIADKITAAIPGAINDTPDSVFLSAGFDSANDPPFRLSGPTATGGLITGIAFVNDILWAVSDTGGLFRVDMPDVDGPPVGPGITTTFVASLGVNFSGLTAGPLEMEDGAFAETLFGVDDSGFVHAFDLNGIPQPIFADGATSVDTGIIGANGIGFSNYQENFWQILGEPRNEDVGHGIVTPVTEIPQGGFQSTDSPLDDKEAEGGDSFYFGQRFRDVQNGRQFESEEVFNYDVPGGARGSLLSEPFSLFEADSADEPYVYFNYLLDTEGSNAEAGEQGDSFRVYLQDDAGQFHLLATNNARRGTGDFDEFDCDDAFCGQDRPTTRTTMGESKSSLIITKALIRTKTATTFQTKGYGGKLAYLSANLPVRSNCDFGLTLAQKGA